MNYDETDRPFAAWWNRHFPSQAVTELIIRAQRPVIDDPYMQALLGRQEMEYGGFVNFTIEVTAELVEETVVPANRLQAEKAADAKLYMERVPCEDFQCFYCWQGTMCFQARSDNIYIYQCTYCKMHVQGDWATFNQEERE